MEKIKERGGTSRMVNKMTVEQFANQTGYTTRYIYSACKDGRIPAQLCHGRYHSPAFIVPQWRAKKYRRVKRTQNTAKNSRDYQNALDKYNAANGTDYSYGMAVARGLVL